jgi:hypothetical protein
MIIKLTMAPIAKRANVAVGPPISLTAVATRAPRRPGSGKFRATAPAPHLWNQRASAPNVVAGPRENQSYMRVSGSNAGMNPRRSVAGRRHKLRASRSVPTPAPAGPSADASNPNGAVSAVVADVPLRIEHPSARHPDCHGRREGDRIALRIKPQLNQPAGTWRRRTICRGCPVPLGGRNPAQPQTHRRLQSSRTCSGRTIDTLLSE